MGLKKKKRVFIGEDHPLFRQSLENLVNNSEHLVLAGSAATGKEIIERVAEARPDIVLLDLNLPKCNGFEVLDFIRQHVPNAKILVLTSYDDDLLADKARKAGASAYMVKDTDEETLLDTIAKLDKEEFQCNVGANQVDVFTADEEYTAILKLTRMEKKILKNLVQGCSVGEMATRFCISENTVKNHKKNIYRKLGVNKQSEAILLCQKHRLLDGV